MDKIQPASASGVYNLGFEFKGEPWSLDTHGCEVFLRDMKKSKFYELDVKGSSAFNTTVVSMAIQKAKEKVPKFSYTLAPTEKDDKLILVIETDTDKLSFAFNPKVVECAKVRI